jgi:hypothetical protein
MKTAAHATRVVDHSQQKDTAPATSTVRISAVSYMSATGRRLEGRGDAKALYVSIQMNTMFMSTASTDTPRHHFFSLRILVPLA